MSILKNIFCLVNSKSNESQVDIVESVLQECELSIIDAELAIRHANKVMEDVRSTLNDCSDELKMIGEELNCNS